MLKELLKNKAELPSRMRDHYQRIQAGGCEVESIAVDIIWLVIVFSAGFVLATVIDIKRDKHDKNSHSN